jgi:hypothetical protein
MWKSQGEFDFEKKRLDEDAIAAMPWAKRALP